MLTISVNRFKLWNRSQIIKMTDKNSIVSAGKYWVLQKLQQLLVRRSVLIKQGQVHSLASKKRNKPFIAIVGREHYKITEKSYPIAKKRAVLNIAKREFKTSELQQFHVGELNNGKRTVKVVTFFSSVNELLPASVKLVLPEHDIALGHDKKQALEYQLESKTYWFAHKGDDVVGAESGGLIRTQEAFEMSIGGVGTRDWITYSFAEFKQHLSQRLTAINWLNLSAYRLNSHGSKDLKRWIPIISGTAVVYGLYFAGVQVWLSASTSQLKEQALQLSQQAAQVFEQQDQLEELNLKTERLQQLVSEQQMDPRIWLPLAPIITSKAQIYRLTYSGRSGYTLEGQSVNATDTLAQLRAHRLVADAGFNNPTVETQGLERFSINLSLRQADANSYRTASDLSLLNDAKPAQQGSQSDEPQRTVNKTTEANKNKASKRPNEVVTEQGLMLLGTEDVDMSELPPSVRKQLRKAEKQKQKNSKEGGNNDD